MRDKKTHSIFLNSMTERNHNEIRIRGVGKDLLEQLTVISKNAGVPLSALLKTKLREIVASYPESMRRARI